MTLSAFVNRDQQGEIWDMQLRTRAKYPTKSLERMRGYIARRGASEDTGAAIKLVDEALQRVIKARRGR